MTDTKHGSKVKVLVVGGGFGGVRAAIELSRRSHLEVTLVSERPDFFYYPTMYETATGGSSEQSTVPLEQIFGDDPVRILIGKADKLNKAKKELKLKGVTEPLHYDKLVLALGVVTNYFGIPGLAENT